MASSPTDPLKRFSGRRADDQQQVAVERERKLMHLVSAFREEISRGHFEAAFALGERLLDLQLRAEAYEALICPIDSGPTGLSGIDLYDLLARLQAYESSTFLPWCLHVHLAILERLGWSEVAFAASAELVQLPERYGWMRFNRAGMLRNYWAYDEANRDYEATLRAAPGFWKAAACLAENSLCQGKEDKAFTLMDECIEQLSRHRLEVERSMAMVWRGEMRLWLGQYAAALADLEAAAEAKDQLALGWRGAAHLLSGDGERALADLDEALALRSFDAEALVWRAEARARRGQWDLASADLDHAVAMSGTSIWPLIGRALLKARTSDTQGMWIDFDLLPGRVRRFFEWKLKIDVGRDPQKAVAVMERMLADARGLRRAESYLLPLWMPIHR